MIILGSSSDYKIAQKAISVFEDMSVNYDIRVASAHRTHARIKDIMTNCTDSIEVFIAIAGLSAHLPGVISSYTNKPVIAVPVDVKLSGYDALISSTEMQLGTPVATMGIDRGDNAAWLACQIIASNDERLKNDLKTYRDSYEEKIEKSEQELLDKITTSQYNRTKRVEHERPVVDKKLELNPETKVLIISANYSNMEIVHNITTTLDTLNIPSENKVIAATRTPDKLEKYMKDVDDQIEAYITVSSLSAILTGAVVSHTTKPVIGVPCGEQIQGLNTLISMIQMPPSVPTATMGINAGENAALYVARILSTYNSDIEKSLEKFLKTLHKNVYY